MDKKDLFLKGKTFAVYYGRGRRENLADFDVVILEPSAWQQSDIMWIQQQNTLVLGYLSVMEISDWASEIELLEEEDFLRKDNTRLINPNFNNFLADMESSRWRSILMHKAARLLGSFGYDGLFLDTMGMAENTMLGEQVQRQVLAVAEFVKELKNTYAEHIIVQNYGIEKILPLTARHIDAACWENPPFENVDSKPWVDKMLNSLLEMNSTHGLKIFLLCEKEVTLNWQYMARRAAELTDNNPDFLYYLAPKDYVHGLNLPTHKKSSK